MSDSANEKVQEINNLNDKLGELARMRMSRRKALATAGKVAIGVGVVAVVGAGGYAAYVASHPPTAQTVTSTATSTVISTAAPSTVTSTTTSVSTSTSTATSVSTATTTSTLGAVAIDVFTISGPMHDLIAHAGTDYNAIHPNISIVAEQTDETTFDATYNTKFSTAPPPDMAFQYPGPAFTYTLASAGLLLELDDYITKYGWDSFNPGYKNYLWNGHSYVMTQDYVSYPNVYYNPEIFTKLGVNVPTTIQEFYDLCSTVSKAGYLTCTFGVNTAPPWTGNVFTFILANLMASDKYTAFISAYGTDFGTPAFQNRTVTWNDTDVVNALTMEQEWGQKIWTPGFTGMADDDAIGLFAQGKAAMYQTGSWGPSVLDPTVTNFTYKVFEFPTDWGTQSTPAIASVDNSFAISSRTKSPDICADFLDFMISKNEQTWQANNEGIFPCRNDLPSTVFTNTHMADNFAIFLKYTPHMVVQLLINGALLNPYVDMIMSVLSGTATPAQAAAQMETTAITQNSQVSTTTTSS